ncbi:uncharacterized protein LOC135927927 [Gordionus sp. m RMFG-2023]|uniref:uncharacterized protein LOC135927927 n=1 Tax=Gordionus sp. m RMFG-2023 TaxID=3053472 RepID=UPI0031FE16DF
MQGDKIHYQPGWDCHGLPIEMKAVNNYGKHKVSNLRRLCKEYALAAIEKQKEAFQIWGVMANWKDCYYTFNNHYESNEILNFFNLFTKGYIFKNFLPIYWSPSSKTTLAESELIYKDNHISKSMYVACKIASTPCSNFKSSPLYAIIWTTTPWTLPFNQAITYNNNFEYACVKFGNDNNHYILLKSVVNKLEEKLNIKAEIVNIFKGNLLRESTYFCPFPFNNSEKISVLLHDDEVQNDKGTGLVHIAPAHGLNDFQIASSHKLNTECHIDEDGRYKKLETSYLNKLPRIYNDLMGLSVTSEETTNIITNNLHKFSIENIFHTTNDNNDDSLNNNTGINMHLENYTHSYPYDWRTHQPVIVKTSHQWFFDTSKLLNSYLSVLNNSINLSKNTSSYPTHEVDNISLNFGMQASAKKMSDSFSSRKYWCISRQRVWGVPIPVFYISLLRQNINKSKIYEPIPCNNNASNEGHATSYTILDDKISLIGKSIILHLCELFKSHGSDIWFDSDIEALLPKHLLKDYLASSNLTGVMLNLGNFNQLPDDKYEFSIDAAQNPVTDEKDYYVVSVRIPSRDVLTFKIERNTDIFDIWFDSGLTWSGVLGNETRSDVVLEGIDQHTGWFQSSLLTRMALKDTLTLSSRPPYKTVLAHGFVVDEYGAKMSKSKGNVISPSLITHGVDDYQDLEVSTITTRKPKMQAYGVDVLRWFVASHSNLATIPFSIDALNNAKSKIAKIRNIIKFLLGASDFKYLNNSLTILSQYSQNFILSNLTMFDRYVLAETIDFGKFIIDKAYRSYQIDNVCREIIKFIDTFISAFFINGIKDRLYCGISPSYNNILKEESGDCKNNNNRVTFEQLMNSANITSYIVLQFLVRYLAPLMPHLAEEISLHQPFNKDSSHILAYNDLIANANLKNRDIDTTNFYASNSYNKNNKDTFLYSVFREPSWITITNEFSDSEKEGKNSQNLSYGSQILDKDIRLAFKLASALKTPYNKLRSQMTHDEKTLDLVISLDPLLFNYVKLLQPTEEKSCHSDLLEIFNTSSITLNILDPNSQNPQILDILELSDSEEFKPVLGQDTTLKYSLHIEPSLNSTCQRCRRKNCAHNTEVENGILCNRCQYYLYKNLDVKKDANNVDIKNDMYA